MATHVHSSSDQAFDRIAARRSGDTLVIRTPNQYISMFWSVLVVAILIMAGLFKLDYFGDMPYLWAVPVLTSAAALFFIRILSTHNQRMTIDRETVLIETQTGRSWVPVQIIPIKDIVTFRVGITGNVEQSSHLGADSIAGFISAKTLGIGWITTVTESRDVAIFFIHIITRKQDHVLSLMNYSRQSSDRVMEQIKEFIQRKPVA